MHNLIPHFAKAHPVAYFAILAFVFTAFALFIERRYGGAETTEPTP